LTLLIGVARHDTRDGNSLVYPGFQCANANMLQE